MSDSIRLVVVFSGQFLNLIVPRDVADITIEAWKNWVKSKAGDTLIGSSSCGFVFRASTVCGMYAIENEAPSPQERMAAALEKQIASGDEWRE